MRFTKGHKLSKGRPKGSLNKFTNVKNAFTEWFEDIGGTAGLHQFIHEPIGEEEQFVDGEFKKKYIYDVHGNKKFLLSLVSKMLTDKAEGDKHNITVNVMPTIKVEVPDINATGTTEDTRNTPKTVTTRYEI